MSIQRMKTLIEELALSSEMGTQFPAIQVELKDAVAEVNDSAYTRALREHIEAAWLSRAREQNLLPAAGKKPTVAYLKAEVSFIVGAMAALDAVLPGKDSLIGPLVPAGWVFAGFSGRGIVKIPA
jgi:hypothetical protein